MKAQMTISVRDFHGFSVEVSRVSYCTYNIRINPFPRGLNILTDRTSAWNIGFAIGMLWLKDNAGQLKDAVWELADKLKAEDPEDMPKNWNEALDMARFELLKACIIGQDERLSKMYREYKEDVDKFTPILEKPELEFGLGHAGFIRIAQSVLAGRLLS